LSTLHQDGLGEIIGAPGVNNWMGKCNIHH